MTVAELKTRVKLRIAKDPENNDRKRAVPNPEADNTYDAEGGADVALIEHQAGLELT
jgi:hypothetical protein